MREDTRHQQWGPTQQQLAASREFWCSDPELAHEHAVVAVEVADRVEAALERGLADRSLVLTLARRIAALKPSG